MESKYSSLRGTAEDLSRRDLCLRRVTQTLEQRKQHTIDSLAEENTMLQVCACIMYKRNACRMLQLDECFEKEWNNSPS